MQNLPKILNYFPIGTTFWRVSANRDKVVMYRVIGANLEERADFEELPKLVYTIEREDGKRFFVSEYYITDSFDDKHAAETALGERRTRPYCYEHPIQPCVADIAQIALSEYGVRQEQIKDNGEYLNILGWVNTNGEYKQEPISCSVCIGERVIVYFDTTYFKTKEECQATEISDYFSLYIKDNLVQSIYDGIDKKKYNENIPSDTVWVMCEDFIKYWIETHYVFSDVTFTNAEMGAFVQLAYNQAKETLCFNRNSVLD